MSKFNIEDYDFIVGVPCSKLKTVLDFDKCIIATREDEAIAMAVAATLCGKRPLVFMQNSGLMNCMDIITSLCIPYNIKVHLLISCRTTPQQHSFCGQITEDVLWLLGYVNNIDYHLIKE